MKRKPRIAVTMGDPGGVGPELCLDVLRHDGVNAACTPIIYGSRAALNRVAEKCGKRPISDDQSRLVEVPTNLPRNLKPGRVHAACGLASFQYVDAAIASARGQDVDAVCTMPINKEAWAAAGIDYPGHTELFAELTQTSKWCMMLTGPGITCSLATVHAGYAEVPGLLKTAGIQDVIDLTADTMRRILRRKPRLAVCGLNPHAGEHGLFGNQEEERIIAPAIAKARKQGHDVQGPLPPDTAFTPEQRRRFDAYICMYHDQGLIPLKALAFDEAVNITLGLPFPRTSPDHGTAFDIAWKGNARPTSTIRAIELAAKMCR